MCGSRTRPQAACLRLNMRALASTEPARPIIHSPAAATVAHCRIVRKDGVCATASPPPPLTQLTD